MIDFILHPSFEKEAAKLKRRFYLDKALESFKMLCEFQFHPLNPQQRIASVKLHRVTQNDLWSIWKIELAVPNLRPNQFPRVWFAVKGSNIAFLCIASYIDNYSDNQMNQEAVGRVEDIF
ncbi:MAG TPA: hypothetical protein DCS28_00540 [Candidatus Moranbacteria bacterium]|nr:hypothetical protein [Candidatus Moranbacteria bacterium]HAT74518.1 hypothetical protein [Candidatus Moranbacteria bacterium]